MGKWKIQVKVGPKYETTSAFESEEAARQAYDDAATELRNKVPFVTIGDLTVKTESVESMQVYEASNGAAFGIA